MNPPLAMKAFRHLLVRPFTFLLSLAFALLVGAALLYARPAASKAQQHFRGANVPGKERLPVPSMADPSTPPAKIPAVFKTFSGRIFSGSQPVVAEDFVFLKTQGINIIVSVDGAKPDVAAAKKVGMRYIHLPIGYDGVPQETQAALRNVLKATQGRIFIHCHHGKHRGPAAAAIAVLLDGSATKDQVLEIMKSCGTGTDYAGLWGSVRKFEPLAPEASAAPLVEIAEVDSLTDSMVKIDGSFERLTHLSKNGWQPDPAHPDVFSGQEALLIYEQFHESSRLAKAAGKHGDLTEGLLHAGELSLALFDALNNKDFAAASRHFGSLASDCRSCHKEHRN